MSTKTSTDTTTPGSTRRRRLQAVAATVLAAIASWIVIEGVTGFDMRAPVFDGSDAGQDIGLMAVALASLVASLAAWGLLAVLERYARRPGRAWIILSTAGLVLSLGAPTSGTGIDLADRAMLVLLHVVVAAVLIPTLYKTATAGQSRNEVTR